VSVFFPAGNRVEAGKTEGIVIAGFGAGTVAAAMVPAIKEARAKGIPVVVTAAPAGRIAPWSAVPGSPLEMERIGCIFAHNLTPQKARILLMLAMTRSHEISAIRKYFDN